MSQDLRRCWVKIPPRNAVLVTGVVIAVAAIISAFALDPATNSVAGEQILATSIASPGAAEPDIHDQVNAVPASPSSSAVSPPTAAAHPVAPAKTSVPVARQAEPVKPQVKQQAPAPPAVNKTTPKPSSGVVEDTAIANSLFSMVNSERAANHLSALRWSSQLVSSAHGHNLAMVSTNTFSHQVPGEASLGARISATGLQWTWVGENIAWSSVTSTSAAESLEADMYNETPPDDGHRLNILSTSATMVGIDVVTDKTGKMWITEDFGN
jgi:uncharacterized protein YkwD